MNEHPEPKSEKPAEDQGTLGERYELSGDFRGAVINIKSTLVGAAEARDIEDLKPEPGEAPFPGLQYFTEKDSQRFFGREKLTAQIVGRLHRTRFLAIIGASGSGKSSLVRAGVIPALRSGERLADGCLPPTDSQSWAMEVFTPTAHPLEALAACLLPKSASLDEIARLSDELAQDARGLTLAVRQRLSKEGAGHLLLVIDQFEELFTRCRHKDEREKFIHNMLNAVDPQDEQPITILITLRADYYAQVAGHDQLRQLISQRQEFIGAMSREELVQAIDGPLAQGDWKIQDGLIEVILDDIGYEPGALPLLSHALLETWRRRRGRTLTLSGYTESGGVRGAIAKTAESVFRQRLTPEQQPVARMIFLRMAEVDEDAHDTRRRATYSELITRSTDEMVINAVIKILVDARLLTTDTLQPGDTRVVEVAHEALIREWPTLQSWLNEDRQGLILHQRLCDATQEWIKLDQDTSLLYRGVRLESVVAWADEHPDLVSIRERQFLEASQELVRREAARAERLARAARNQRILLGVATVLVLAVSYLAYRFILRVEPARMNGFYNIAVAQFGVVEPSGAVSPGSDNDLGALDESVYQIISGELGENPNILIWHDGPEMNGKNVSLGLVEGADAAQRASAADELAQRVGADMVIYGNIEMNHTTPQLAMEFYLRPRPGYDYQDLVGNFRLTSPLSPTNSLPPTLEDQASQKADRLAGTMAWMALGLTEANLGHSLEALEAFLDAERLSPESEMIQFFMGREYLFLVDREAVLQFARQEFEHQAEMAFKSAIELNPDYARAYIGLAGVYFKRAQNQVRDSSSESGDQAQGEGQYQSAEQNLAQAVAFYQQVLDSASGSKGYGIPITAVARLGLGNTYRLQGEVLQRRGDLDQAREYFQRAIETLEPAVQPLAQASQERYLTQAYEYLGASFQWLALNYEGSQDFSRMLEAYHQADDYYQQCISQGESSADLIIKDDIVAKNCQPDGRQVRDVIENYTGGQG